MKPIHILLVEDNEGDILLTTEALEEGRLVKQISIAKDGKAAIDFLNKHSHEVPGGLPDLVLLDINLPKKNGFEVLRHIKTSDYLKQIPVIMLTTSSSEKDKMLCGLNSADLYLSKPLEALQSLNVIESIKQFWKDFVQQRS
jgi:CheY-like chemotaxis protein